MVCLICPRHSKRFRFGLLNYFGGAFRIISVQSSELFRCSFLNYFGAVGFSFRHCGPCWRFGCTLELFRCGPSWDHFYVTLCMEHRCEAPFSYWSNYFAAPLDYFAVAQLSYPCTVPSVQSFPGKCKPPPLAVPSPLPTQTITIGEVLEFLGLQLELIKGSESIFAHWIGGCNVIVQW